MDTLSGEIKRYQSMYAKNNNYNFEITIGNSLGKYIFDTHVSNKYWMGIQQKLEGGGDYKARREFTYRIYSLHEMKLYIDSSDNKRCVQKELRGCSHCYNNTGGFDFKISMYDRNTYNTAVFPPVHEYNSVVKRHTISYNYNGYYINLSKNTPIEGASGQTFYTITILFSKSKTSKNIVLKSLLKHIKTIYTVTGVDMEDFNVHVQKE